VVDDSSPNSRRAMGTTGSATFGLRRAGLAGTDPSGGEHALQHTEHLVHGAGWQPSHAPHHPHPSDGPQLIRDHGRVLRISAPWVGSSETR